MYVKEYSALEGASLIFVFLRILTVTSAFPWNKGVLGLAFLFPWVLRVVGFFPFPFLIVWNVVGWCEGYMEPAEKNQEFFLGRWEGREGSLVGELGGGEELRSMYHFSGITNCSNGLWRWIYTLMRRNCQDIRRLGIVHFVCGDEEKGESFYE
ncbi:hypothetical protein K440DRAFT_24121 [Wilcoxina mikolae CBS 423.85]|nr:hypothetical protein K440DRAFT_24121 [Wilcoxina mikolae CBS 423.85]